RVVGGDRVAAGKPSPDIFLHAAAELEAAPAEALVFEDAEIGIQAAVQAGMRVVMIPDVLAPTEKLEALCYAVLPSLNTAAEQIEELIA
ncbi:MAG: HAD-IA family hydrolase, partial [Spirochaetaceae bacterium]